MSKETKISSITSYVDTHWTDHPAVEWISNNKQSILWIIVGLFAVLILSYRILMNHTLNAETDFFRAQTDFVKFQDAALNSNNHLTDAASLSNLEDLMKSYPELHEKYDGPLAQTLLIEGQIPQAEAFAKDTFKRTANDSIQIYHEYAATSLLISKKQYQEALTKTQELNSKLSSEIGSPLYFFNLIREALLSQQLGLEKEEKLLWENIKNYQQQTNSPEMINLFRSGQATLNQYMDSRLQILNRAG